MKEITWEESEQHLGQDAVESGKIGLLCEWGAINSDAPFVVVYGDGHLEGKYFLATQDDFEHSKDGVFVRIKDLENTTPLPEFNDVFEVKRV